jgi:hypothetical protein
VQVKLWGIDMDEDSNRLGSSSAEMRRVMHDNQKDMAALHRLHRFPMSDVLRRFLAPGASFHPGELECNTS